MPRAKHLIPHWRNIWRFIRDPKSDWKPKVLVALAVLYMAWPLDLIPDLVPLFGWLEDIGFDVIAAWYLVHATNRYLEEKKNVVSSEAERPS